MSAVKPEGLKKAYRKEKDPKVKIRITVANMTCINGRSMLEAVDDLMRCPNQISF